MEALRGPSPLAADSIAIGYATLVRLHQARKRHHKALALLNVKGVSPVCLDLSTTAVTCAIPGMLHHAKNRQG
jgi:hypothetical protein